MTLFIIFIIFSVWLRYEISHSSKIDRKNISEFWEKEYQSQYTRKQDISTLPFLQISESELPHIVTSNETLIELQHKVILASKNKMLNLSHKSNADIKLEYGVANFPLLVEYDQNFLVFTRDLFLFGKRLYDENYLWEATNVLELVIHYGADIHGAFITLANIYKSRNEIEKISNLIQTVEDMNSILKPSILKALKESINTY